MIRFGIIGFGYWGPNVARNVMAMQEATLEMICDSDPDALKRCKAMYRHVTLTNDADAILKSKSIDVVAVVTPVATHFEIAQKALENGKHVFVEKPFTRTAKEAQTLIDLAEKKKLKIMVDHVFIFTGAVRKIKELIDQDKMGHLYYYDSLRSSLGLFRPDVNVIWDLAPHDFSILDYLFENKLVGVSAQGLDHMGRGYENMAYITGYFENKCMAHISVNWLSPVKIRTILIGGEKSMLVWDDLLTDEKIKVYDKGVTIKNKEGSYRLMVDYRSGDMWSPRVDPTEALTVELNYFVDCIKKDKDPINDGHSGLRVVKMLTATTESLKKKGKMIKV